MRSRSDKMRSAKKQVMWCWQVHLLLWLWLWKLGDIQLAATRCFEHVTDSTGWCPGQDSPQAGRLKHWNEYLLYISNKDRNKAQRSTNSNISNQIKIVHWNLGSRLWKNKLLDIQSLLNEFKPDLCYISEENLWDGCPQTIW